MHTNCIKNLLNLKDVEVKNIKNLKDKVEIYIELPIFLLICRLFLTNSNNFIIFLEFLSSYSFD